MDTLTFKDAGADDRTQLFQLFASVRADDLGMHTWEPALRDQMLRLQFEAQRRGYLQQFPDADARLILRNGSPVGWVIVDRSDAGLRVVDIAILSSERCQGVGTRVLRALQEEAAAEDRPVTLSVMHLNVRALELYLRLGFRAVGETDLHTLMEWRR